MKQSINFSQFHDAFRDHDRLDNFSYDGLKALYEWIEDLDEQCDTETELDVIALCCEFTEYASADEAASNYFDYEGMEYDDDGGELNTPEEVEEKALNYLRDSTLAIEFDSGIIIQDF